jgi:N-glycosylase/DNA lyase
VFPMRYELDFYTLLNRNSVFKGQCCLRKQLLFTVRIIRYAQIHIVGKNKEFSMLKVVYTVTTGH